MKEKKEEKKVEQEKKEEKKEVNPLQAKVDELTKEVATWKDKAYRTVADCDNLRKSYEKDHQLMVKYRGQPFVEKLLPTLDSFYLVLKVTPEDPTLKNYLIGFEMIYKSMIDALTSEGVKQVLPKKGEKFDYNKHLVQSLTTEKQACSKVKDLKTDWIIMGWQTSGVLNRKDYATLQVIDSLLGSGMSSRLFKNLRDRDGLAYQLGSQFSPHILKGSFITYIGTNPENLDYAQKRMKEEVFRLKTEFVGSKELQEAKDKLLGHYIIGQETNLDKATTIGWFEVSGRGYEFDEQYSQLINSVTESDIIEVANKVFTNNYVLSIVKPQ